MQVRDVTRGGAGGIVGSCVAFVMHLVFTSSSLTLPSSPCPGGAWVRSPLALSKATFLFRQLLNLVLTGTESFWGASSIPGGDLSCVASGRRWLETEAIPKAGWDRCCCFQLSPCHAEGVKKQSVKGSLRPSVHCWDPLVINLCIQQVFTRCLPGPMPALGVRMRRDPVPVPLLTSPSLSFAFFLPQGTAKTLGH